MILQNVSVKEINNYLHLDPFDRLWKVALPGYVCIGALEKSEGEPIGVLLYSTFWDELMIDWIFVTEEFREAGVGELLLNEVFEQALLGGRQFVCAGISCDKRESKLFPNREGYFGLHYFEEGYETSGEWNITLKNLKDSFSDVGEPASTIYLDLLDKKKFKAVFDAFEDSPKKELLFPLWEKPELLDPAISVLHSKKDRLSGALFMVKVQNRLYVAGHLAEDKKCFESMIKVMVDAALEKYPENAMVTFRDVYREDGGLLSEISKDRNTKYRIRVADTERFYNAQTYGPDEDYELMDKFMPF